MNKYRRAELTKANKLIENAETIIETVRDDEEDALNNIPENLEDSELYNTINNNVDELNDLYDDLTEINERISEIIGK